MFNPKFLIRLNKGFFLKNYAACLGSQLLQIVNFIESYIPPQTWFGADINCISNDKNLIKYNSFFLTEIGDVSLLKQFLMNVDQFSSGVFLALRKEIFAKNNLMALRTEDPEYRSLNINGVILEIRAFDTSYFEIYSDDSELIKQISNNYHVEIKTRTSQ